MKWNFDFTKLSLAALKELRAGIDSAFSLIREYLLRKWTELGKFFDRRNEERERKKLEQDLLICDEMRKGAKEELDAEIGRRGNGGKQTNGESSASFDAVPPFELFGTTKDDEIESAVAKEFSGLSIKDIVEKEYGLKAKYQNWRNQMIRNQPKKKSYSDEAVFNQTLECWNQQLRSGEILFTVVRAKVDTIINPMPIADADDALRKIERNRERNLGEKRADDVTKDIVSLADSINKYIERQSKEERLKRLIDAKKTDLTDAMANGQKGRASRLEKRINQLMEILGNLRQEAPNSIKEGNRRDNRDTEKRQQETMAIIKLLFPDNGGKILFSDGYRRKAFEEAKNAGFEDSVEIGFNILDVIAKSYNTASRDYCDLNMFSIIDHVVENGKAVYGSCSSSLGHIKMSKLDLDGERCSIWDFVATFLHEHGHYFEQAVLSADISDRNVQSLCAELHFDISKAPATESFNVPHVRKPSLCVREDSYSYKVSKKKRVSGNVQGTLVEYRTSEVISTAFEYLARDPELFIRRCPWQFNLLLANLRELQVPQVNATEK